jgi:hypothetical protein
MLPTHSFNQNQTVNSGPINHQNGSINGNYQHSGMSQSAFGGFNFGMSNNLNAVNLMPSNNQNLSFSRPQTSINREPTVSQANKASNFDQQTSNKCWSVGKLPTR